MNFGEQIKKLRSDRNITQQEMADALGISRQAVSHWENNRNLPDIELLIEIAKNFSISLDELILGGKEMNNMTEKLINDGSENKRRKLNLSCARIGMGLFALSLLSYFAGVFLIPIEFENYFSAFSSLTMVSGFLAFFVIGMKSAAEILKAKNGKKKNHIAAAGLGMMIAGIGLYVLNLSTGVIHGLWGIGLSILGIIVMALSRLMK